MILDRIKTAYRRWQLRRQGFTVVDWTDPGDELHTLGYPIFESVEELEEYPKKVRAEIEERGRGGLTTETLVEWR